METIEKVNLKVSVDLYYQVLKDFVGGFGWSTTLKKSDIDKSQADMLDFLSEQHVKRNLGRLEVCFYCTKIGKEQKQNVGITRIEKVKDGWKIGDDY